MATVKNPAVPPSLEDRYNELVQLNRSSKSGVYHGQTNPNARTAKPTYEMPVAAAIATTAALWLTRTHAANSSESARSAFYAARRAEIMAGQMPAEYWIELQHSSDRTQVAYPTCKPDSQQPAGAYDDPLRRPSICAYKEWDHEYETPQGAGTGADPAPGWAGAVDGVHFEDLYMAQRALRYELPEEIEQGDGRPILARIAATITAQATARGNRIWYSIYARPGFSPSEAGLNTYRDAYDHWTKAEQYRYGIPAAAPGWSHTVQRTITSDMRMENEKWWRANWLQVHVATAPGLGRYHSRNDAVEVHHNEDVHVYLAR